MAGSVGVPTPWWQIEGPIGRSPAAAAANLDASAPPGYQYDRVQMKYVPIVGSATDALAQRAREQAIQDSLLKGFGATGTGLDGGGAVDDGAFGSTSSAYTPPPTVSYGGSAGAPGGGYGGGGGPAAIPHVQVPDTSAAQAAVFNRAKDQVGEETSGSLTALRSALAGRGLLGAGLEAKGTTNVLTKGQQQLGDTTREQAIQEAQRQNDFATLGYRGDIEQRGQDVTTSEGAANRAATAANTQFTGGVTERGQDISGGNAAADRALDAWKTKYSGAITTRGQNLNATSALMSKLY